MTTENPEHQGEGLRELRNSVDQFLQNQDFVQARDLLASQLEGPLRRQVIAQYAVVLYLLKAEDAIEWLERAVDEADQPAMAYVNLGTAREKEGRLDEARQLFVAALTHVPMSSEALLGLGRVEFLAKRYDEALTAFRQAHTFDRRNITPIQHMISVFEVMGEVEDAVASYRLLLGLLEPVSALTSLLKSCNILQPEPLETVAFEHLKMQPQDHASRILIAKYLLKKGRTVEAIGLLSTEDFDAERDGDWTLTLAVAYHDLGFSEKANLLLMRYLRSREPRDFNWPPLLLLQHYLPERTQADITRLHRIWGEHQVRSSFTVQRHSRRKRIAFIGGDFRNHPVGFFCVPLFEGLKRRGYQIDIYDTNPADDATAQRLKSCAETVTLIRGVDDDAVVRKVRERGAHFAVDLSGHTRGARLPIFARRVAEYQFTAYGYVNTTGLTSMDGILSDPYQILESEEGTYTEDVLRLPRTYIVYEAPPWLPRLTERRPDRSLIFGSLNRAAKLGPATIARFSKALNAFPGSNLLLAAPGLNNRLVQSDVAKRFAAHGVGLERIEFRGGAAHEDFLNFYNDMDIALDTAPYSGGLTTCEALMMGTPVVTQAASTMASRHSLGHLTNAGFSQWAFESEEDLVEGVSQIASDILAGRLTKSGVRKEVADSGLCDKARYLDEFCALLERL